MKKLLSIAIAAAFVAPMAASADTTMYGLIDNALTRYDDGTNAAAWDVKQGNGTSRFGVKGNEDLGNGMKAIFQYEWATQTTEGGSTQSGFTNRLGYVGLTGGFGTVAIGRQWTPYYGAVGKTNIMNAPSAGFRQSLNSYRTGNALAYVTPNMNGFSAVAAFVMDQAGGADTENSVDGTSLALKYDNGPLSLGLGYNAFQSNSATNATANDQDTLGVSGKYNFGSFALVGAYETRDFGAADSTAWSLGAEAYFGNNTLRALVGKTKNDASADAKSWALGLQHNFSKRTFVYAEYASENISATSADPSEFALGLRHDF